MAPNSTVVVAHMEGISMRTGSHPPLAVTWPCRLHIEATRWRDGVRAGGKEQQFCRFDEQQAHGRGRGNKLYRSFYMR